MTEIETLKFPTKFPIKIFGLANDRFIKTVKTAINKNVDKKDQLDWQQNISKKGNYLAITVTIIAQDKQQLDSIYMALSNNKNVKMAL